MGVVIADEVAAYLGESSVSRLRRDGIRASCAICKVQVSSFDGDDVSVCVAQHLDQDAIFFCHQGCAASQIRATGRMARPIATDDVTFWAIVLPSHPKPRSILALHPHVDELLMESGDLFDPAVSGLLQNGWTMLTSVGKTPPILEGWRVEMDPLTGAGRILGPGGEVFLDSLPQEEPWINVARSSASVTVVVGRVAHIRSEGAEQLKELQTLAQAGQLVAAQVKVFIVNSPRSELQLAGVRVANLLKRAADAVARVPGDPTPKSQILQFHKNPTLSPALFRAVAPMTGRLALLFIDFCEEDVHHAEILRASLLECGAKIGPSSDKSFLLPRAPEGWTALVWLSQIKVLVGGGGTSSVPATLLFDRIGHPDREWYDVVRSANAVGLVFGNQMGSEPYADLEVMVRSEEVVGMAIPAITAN